MAQYNVVVKHSFNEVEEFNEYEPKSQNWEDIVACFNEQVVEVLRELDGETATIEHSVLNEDQPLLNLNIWNNDVDWYYEIYVCKVKE